MLLLVTLLFGVVTKEGSSAFKGQFQRLRETSAVQAWLRSMGTPETVFKELGTVEEQGFQGLAGQAA